MNFLKKLFKTETHCNLDICCSHCGQHHQMKKCDHCGEKNICKHCFKTEKLCKSCDIEYEKWSKTIVEEHQNIQQLKKLETYSVKNHGHLIKHLL